MRPVKWVQLVSGMNYADILKESNSIVVDVLADSHTEALPQKVNTETLPEDPINLLDEQQVNFYRSNNIVQEALKVLHSRRLDVAANKPKTFWLSLTDKVHKNRLIIPFYGLDGKIAHYQSRTIIESKKIRLPKYLSKSNSEKTLFGIDQVAEKSKFIFVTEGPIDACFIKNGVAVAGINEGKGSLFTKRQQEQLQQFSTYELVWVLDNQTTDKASFNKTKFLIANGCKVFIWPKELKKFKDINELCINQHINYVPEKFILRNSYSGLKAKLILSGKN